MAFAIDSLLDYFVVFCEDSWDEFGADVALAIDFLLDSFVIFSKVSWGSGAGRYRIFLAKSAKKRLI